MIVLAKEENALYEITEIYRKALKRRNMKINRNKMDIKVLKKTTQNHTVQLKGEK